MTDTPDITATSSRIVYENKWMRVREDGIRRRDGSAGIYGVVEKPDFALIVPIENGVLHLVEQYRYPVGGRYREFPQGSWPSQPDMDPAALARAELEEETGLTAASMVHVAHIFEAYGMSNQGAHIFLATGLVAGAPRPDAEEADLITRAFTVAEVQEMILDGRIKDACSIAAFGILRLKGLL